MRVYLSPKVKKISHDENKNNIEYTRKKPPTIAKISHLPKGFDIEGEDLKVIKKIKLITTVHIRWDRKNFSYCDGPAGHMFGITTPIIGTYIS